MRALFLMAFFYVASFATAQAQTTAKDSIAQIENERLELIRMQERIRFKQDSLVRVRLKIEEEQKKAEEAKRAEAAKQEPVTAPAVFEPAPVTKVPKRQVKNVVGIAPVQMFITGVEVFYERVIGKKTSLVLSGGYHGMENFPRQNNTSSSGSSSSSTTLGAAFLSGDRVANYGVRAQVQLRAYLFEEAEVLEKLYIAPTFLYKHDEMVYVTNRYNVNNGSASPNYNYFFAEAIVPGVDVGYQLKVLRFFTVNPFVGFMYTVPISSKEDAGEVNVDFLNPYRQNLMIRTGLTIGFTY